MSDNLKRAIQAAPESTDDQMKTFILGVEMTEKELSNIFERFHIQAIHPENEKFDHNLHQAMFEIEDTEKSQEQLFKFFSLDMFFMNAS